jgi:oligoendopeptidase F
MPPGPKSNTSKAAWHSGPIWLWSTHSSIGSTRIPDAAADPARCDEQWAQLWQRFMPGIDFSGLEDVMMTGWHRKLHIHQLPFYYVEYGLAQLGAVQVWGNSLKNPIDAVQDYRYALSLGGTATLPNLFQAAGARLSFDAQTLQAAINLMETTIESLTEQR